MHICHAFWVQFLLIHKYLSLLHILLLKLIDVSRTASALHGWHILIRNRATELETVSNASYNAFKFPGFWTISRSVTCIFYACFNIICLAEFFVRSKATSFDCSRGISILGITFDLLICRHFLLWLLILWVILSTLFEIVEDISVPLVSNPGTHHAGKLCQITAVLESSSAATEITLCGIKILKWWLDMFWMPSVF